MAIENPNIGAGNPAIGPDRHLARALEKVSDSWFPVDPILFNKIKGGLESGVYDLDVSFLISELKTDFGLFTYCVRELLRMVREKKMFLPAAASPMELLQNAGVEKLKNILNVPIEEISTFNFKELSDVQGARLQESMISATTAELLSEKQNVDPGVGYSAGLMRQLGITLIAWNYASVYKRVVSSLDGNISLDDALTRALGFSPKLLGVTIAKQWGLSPELRAAMGDNQAKSALKGEQAQATDNIGSTLKKLCEIGEALARANDPEHYPTAKDDWHAARKEIERYLGPSGIRTIQDRVRENCEHYHSQAPDLFKATVELAPESKIHHFNEGSLYRDNRYAQTLPEAAKEKFKRLYALVTPAAVSKAGVSYWAQEVATTTGFVRGCVFIINPDTMMLIPRLKVGDVKLEDFEPASYASAASGSDRILAAYRCNSPIVENTVSAAGTSICIITGLLGTTQKAGVLCLESSQGLLYDPLANPLNYFKALSQALCDCLNLR